MFPWQQWLHECPMLLRYTYAAQFVAPINNNPIHLYLAHKPMLHLRWSASLPKQGPIFDSRPQWVQFVVGKITPRNVFRQVLRFILSG
jgi:hypothetical protein